MTLSKKRHNNNVNDVHVSISHLPGKCRHLIGRATSHAKQSTFHIVRLESKWNVYGAEGPVLAHFENTLTVIENSVVVPCQQGVEIYRVSRRRIPTNSGAKLFKFSYPRHEHII